MKWCKGGANSGGVFLEVGLTRANFWLGCASRASGDEGLVAIQLESDPPERSAHESGTRIVHLQGVRATQVHRDSRGRVDHELAGRGPDIGVNGSAIQGNPLQASAHGKQAQACARLHLDLADTFSLQAGARLVVGFKYLANAEAVGSFFAADRLSSDPRCSGEAGYIPTRDGYGGWVAFAQQKCDYGDDYHGGGGRRQNGKKSHPPRKEPVSSAADDLRKYRSGAVMSELCEQSFQPLDFRIGLARSIPQIVVALCLWVVFGAVVFRVHDYGVSCCGSLLLGFGLSFARSWCMPRCRLTRTEPGVRPVRAAISGPVMPSTSRRINVSR